MFYGLQIITALPKLPDRSQLAIAMRSAITRLKKLEVYLENGTLEIDSNAAERSMKNLAAMELDAGIRVTDPQ